VPNPPTTHFIYCAPDFNALIPLPTAPDPLSGRSSARTTPSPARKVLENMDRSTARAKSFHNNGGKED